MVLIHLRQTKSLGASLLSPSGFLAFLSSALPITGNHPPLPPPNLLWIAEVGYQCLPKMAHENGASNFELFSPAIFLCEPLDLLYANLI